MNDLQKSAASTIVNTIKNINGSALELNKIEHEVGAVHGVMDLRSVLGNLIAHNVLFHIPDKTTGSGTISHHGYYGLTDKGYTFESYDKLLEEVKHKEDLEKALINSSITANKSVNRVNKLFWITVFLAAMSAAGTIATVYIELYKIK